MSWRKEQKYPEKKKMLAQRELGGEERKVSTSLLTPQLTWGWEPKPKINLGCVKVAGKAPRGLCLIFSFTHPAEESGLELRDGEGLWGPARGGMGLIPITHQGRAGGPTGAFFFFSRQVPVSIRALGQRREVCAEWNRTSKQFQLCGWFWESPFSAGKHRALTEGAAPGSSQRARRPESRSESCCRDAAGQAFHDSGVLEAPGPPSPRGSRETGSNAGIPAASPFLFPCIHPPG